MLAELVNFVNRVSGIYEREVRFYAELAGSVPIRVPECYYGRIDDNDVSKVDGNLSAFNSYKDFDDEGDIAEHSLSKLIASTNPDLDEEIKTLIFASAKAIQAIPQPFRNNIDSESNTAGSSSTK